MNTLNLLFALPVERAFDNRKELTRMTLDSWQLFLAEARKKFLLNEILAKNHLTLNGLVGGVLELDSGISKLDATLRRSGIRSQRVNLGQKIPQGIFGLSVSHNQLEHFPNLDTVNKTLDELKINTAYGMVHQVHAMDDPAFEWDNTHNLRLTSLQWDDYFRNWAENNASDGWTYLGSHKGAPGRPSNFILEKNGSFPFYKDYDEQLIRKLIHELTLANGISITRIPLLLTSFSIAQDNPYLLAGLIGAVHVLDAADGYVARRGLGNSPLGPHFDIEVDHFVEGFVMFNYAYQKGYIPKSAFWVTGVRNLSTDFLRLYNAFKVGVGTDAANPHKAFGDMVIPVLPRLGLQITAIHLSASLARAIPVWTSPTTQEIYREVLNKISKVRSLD